MKFKIQISDNDVREFDDENPEEFIDFCRLEYEPYEVFESVEHELNRIAIDIYTTALFERNSRNFDSCCGSCWRHCC